MFTPAELIEALRRRTRRSLRPESQVGEYPPGWRAWFAALREQAGVISGATADAIVAIFLQRELRRAPARAAALSDWQAFNTLWRQEWHPASSDQRAQRIAALTITVVVELILAVLLLWLAYARWGGTPPPPGEEIVQVEFIGEGTPQERGGGAPTGPAPAPMAAAASSAASAAASQPSRIAPTPAPAASSAAPAPAVAAADAAPAAAEPTPVEPVPPQPLQVTQVAVPDTSFALRVPELQAQPQAIEIVELPQAERRRVDTPAAQVMVPQVKAQARALPSPAPPLQDAVARDIPRTQVPLRVPGLQSQVQALPAPSAPLPGVSARAVPTPQAQVAVPGLETGVASLPMPAPASAGAGGGAEQGLDGAAATQDGNGATAGAAAAQPGGQSAVAGGVQGTQAGAGAGPKPGAPAGAWSSARAGDDWGVSDRNQAGGQSGSAGLFGDSGRVNLPPGTVADTVSPPGVVEADIADLDRAGTWLKRPPINYTPTRFDRYWMPGGTLLEEWVRRGIKEVAIKIPGTSKKIHCVVSLLQLGGGCGITDPDLQDQEAAARPPPDIPWKPGLQENQGDL